MSFVTLDPKDPDSLNVNYVFDLSSYLGTGETIASIVSVTSSDAGIAIESSEITDSSKSITVYLSGGTPGYAANITARFTVSGSPTRTDDRTFRIYIQEL